MPGSYYSDVERTVYLTYYILMEVATTCRGAIQHGRLISVRVTGVDQTGAWISRAVETGGRIATLTISWLGP